MESETLVQLQRLNPQMQILPCDAPDFARYGRVLEGIPVERALAYAREHARPGEGVTYEPSIEALEDDAGLVKALDGQVYGEMPLQIGWVYGHNTTMNALEYHRGSEVLAAATEIVVLLGSYSEIRWRPELAFDSGSVKAFYTPRGTAFELFPLTLHYAPVQVRGKEGFIALVALPKPTNTPLIEEPSRVGEAVLLLACNKWVLAHPEAEQLVSGGAYPGIRGENLRIRGLA